MKNSKNQYKKNKFSKEESKSFKIMDSILTILIASLILLSIIYILNQL